MKTSVALTLVGFADYPCRCVTDTKVQDLTPLHHVVKRLHQLGNTCGKVPPVDVE